jgi:hypothetical protein
VNAHVEVTHTYVVSRKQKNEIHHSLTPKAAHEHRLSSFRSSQNLQRQEETQIVQLSELPLRIEVTPEPKSESHGGRLKEGMARATQMPSGGRSRTFCTSRTSHFSLVE